MVWLQSAKRTAYVSRHGPELPRTHRDRHSPQSIPPHRINRSDAPKRSQSPAHNKRFDPPIPHGLATSTFRSKYQNSRDHKTTSCWINVLQRAAVSHHNRLWMPLCSEHQITFDRWLLPCAHKHCKCLLHRRPTPISISGFLDPASTNSKCQTF